jgi:hypothetical protein
MAENHFSHACGTRNYRGNVFPTLAHPPRCVLMGRKYPRKPSDVIFPTAVAPGVKPGIVGHPHQSIIFLGPRQWAPGPKQWVGRLVWSYIYICSLQPRAQI